MLYLLFLNACLKSLCTEALSHNVLTFGTDYLQALAKWLDLLFINQKTNSPFF